jgi:hypothetical protein
LKEKIHHLLFWHSTPMRRKWKKPAGQGIIIQFQAPGCNPDSQRTCMSPMLFFMMETSPKTEELCICLLLGAFVYQFQNILVMFVKPSAVLATSSLITVQYQGRQNQKDNSDSAIGTAAREFTCSIMIQLTS